MYLLIKYIKSVLWRVAKRLSYIGDAWCLKVNGSDDDLLCSNSEGDVNVTSVWKMKTLTVNIETVTENGKGR